MCVRVRVRVCVRVRVRVLLHVSDFPCFSSRIMNDFLRVFFQHALSKCGRHKQRLCTLLCLAMVSMRKLVLTLSTFGTRIEEYSGLESDG